jgi:hypothetical protein
MTFKGTLTNIMLLEFVIRISLDTVAASDLSISAFTRSGAVLQAAEWQALKHSHLVCTRLIQSLAIETSVPVDESAITFFSDVGSRLSSMSVSCLPQI